MSNPIHWSRDDEGIVTLTLDLPGSANVMNAAYRDAMGATVERLQAEVEDVTGVVITSAKHTFFAGGDLNTLVQVDRAHAAEFRRELDVVKGQLRALETLGRPVVAAINGSALGGGLELALACHHRVCLNDPSIRLGFPEVTLGLLPGAGGIARTVRMIGVQAALPLLSEGRQLRPEQALRTGWIDELAADREELLARARAWALADPQPVQPWDQPGHRVPDLRAFDPESYPLLAAAPAVVRQKTHGCYPAVERILAAAVEGALLDFETALAVESDYMTELTTGQTAKNMIGTFWFQLNEIKAGRSRPQGPEVRPVRRVGVLGAGMMGAGIAEVSARAGIEVVLKDVDEAAARRGVDGIAGRLEKLVAKGRLTDGKRDALLARITPTGSDADLAGCDLVVEAVFENRELKLQVLGAAEKEVLPDAVIASNTSTLPITGLAEGVPEPERFIGLHFFSPVDRMPLVEIITGRQTSPETLARAFDYVLQIGKTPIVVNDSRGFYTSRTFGTYLTEGITLLGEGVHPALIENVARKAGMAVGPLAVCDEVTLTLPLKIRDQTLTDLGDAAPEELSSSPAYEVLLAMTGELGRTGKAGGAGFYEYPAEGGKFLWPGLVQRWTQGDGLGVPEEDVRDRLLYVQALETVRILEEGVLTSVADANVGSVFGIGFAPWTGGTLQFVNATGLPEFIARADELAETYGERFRPTDALRARAAAGQRF